MSNFEYFLRKNGKWKILKNAEKNAEKKNFPYFDKISIKRKTENFQLLLLS